MTWRLVAALSATLLFCCDPAAGQRTASVGDTVRAPRAAAPATDSSENATERLARPPVSSLVGVWGGGSVQSGSILGKISGGRVGLLGIRYHRRLIPRSTDRPARHDGPTLTYTADVVPLATVSIPKGAGSGTSVSDIESVKEAGLSTVGVGAYPLGLRVGVRPSAVVRPFLAGHTGVFYFGDPVPDERGRQTNFAAGVGAGVQIPLARRTILTLGYRYHHLSNGFRGSINPGLDANVLYIGLGVAPRTK